MARKRSGRESGSASLELVVVAPVLIVFFVFVVGLGRLALARQDVNAAAYEAARAASLQRNVPAASAEGRAAATRTLGARGLSCSSVTINVDVSSYRPGGQVTASVTCLAALGDVAMAGFPGTKTYRADAVVPIEQYRADQ